jgi:hypothetical protein
MFDLHGLRIQRRPDPDRLALEQPRPLGVVLGEVDRRVVLGEISDNRGTYLVVRERHAETLSGATFDHEVCEKQRFEEREVG